MRTAERTFVRMNTNVRDELTVEIELLVAGLAFVRRHDTGQRREQSANKNV